MRSLKVEAIERAQELEQVRAAEHRARLQRLREGAKVPAEVVRVTVNLGEQGRHNLTVREGEPLEEIVAAFLKEHGLPSSAAPQLQADVKKKVCGLVRGVVTTQKETDGCSSLLRCLYGPSCCLLMLSLLWQVVNPARLLLSIPVIDPKGVRRAMVVREGDNATQRAMDFCLAFEVSDHEDDPMCQNLAGNVEAQLKRRSVLEVAQS